MVWKPDTAKSSTRVTFPLDEELYDHLAERAAKRGHKVEHEIAERLALTRNYTALTPIYLDDDVRGQLSQIAGRTIRTPEELLSWARSVSSLTVQGTRIDLSEQLLKRLETRRFGLSLPELLSKLVPEQLEEYVGLR